MTSNICNRLNPHRYILTQYAEDNALVVKVFAQHANTNLRWQEHTTETHVGVGKDRRYILTCRASPSVTTTVSTRRCTLCPALDAVEMVHVITVGAIPDGRLPFHNIAAYHTLVCSSG